MTGSGNRSTAERQPVRHIPRWAWWLFMLLPMAFILAGSIMLIDAMMFAGRAEHALATVVSVERTGGIAQGKPDESAQAAEYAYLPTVSYVDRLGIDRQAVTHIRASHYDYAPGTRVEVLYDPDDTGTVRITGFFSQWGLPLIFLTLGWAFLMIVRLIRRKMMAAG